MKKFQDYKEMTIFEFKNFSDKDRDAYFVEANKFFKKYLYTKKVPGHLDNEDIIQVVFVFGNTMTCCGNIVPAFL